MKYVIKIGGSLYTRVQLDHALSHAVRLVRAPHGAIIVPGGGPFADQVRRAQKRWPFADETAHRMALLAMRQYGWMLAALARLPTTEQPQRLAPGGCTVWLPSEDCSTWLPAKRPVPDFDWRLTSDSIAAALAARLGAQWLILVKAASVEEAGGIGELVDECFCRMVEGSSVRVGCASIDEWNNLQRLSQVSEIDVQDARHPEPERLT